eukprot:scaffold2119_cov264-Pinguiococcus_pyrenoidosus.AAC.18
MRLPGSSSQRLPSPARRRNSHSLPTTTAAAAFLFGRSRRLRGHRAAHHWCTERQANAEGASRSMLPIRPELSSAVQSSDHLGPRPHRVDTRCPRPFLQ